MVKNNLFIRLFTIVVLLSGLTAANDRAIKKAVKKYTPTILELRHRIHQNPELGNREFKTAEMVANPVQFRVDATATAPNRHLPAESPPNDSKCRHSSPSKLGPRNRPTFGIIRKSVSAG